MYTISHDLDDGLGEGAWIILAYTITYLGFTVIIARLSDVLGRRWTVTGCFIVFIAMSVACGCAQTMTQLFAFRALQGIGAAGMYAMAMIVLPEISPISLLPALSSMIGTAVATGSVLGPILGGVITQDSTWRWSVLMILPYTTSHHMADLFTGSSSSMGQSPLPDWQRFWSPVLESYVGKSWRDKG